MQKFASSREAKEFLVSKIVAQAQREDVPLSEVERKMLYFTETAWTLPDMAEVSEAFRRDYDEDEYEEKIQSLCRNSCNDARNNPAELATWKAALQALSAEDHYILVLADTVRRPTRPLSMRFPVLLVSGSLIAGILFTILYALLRR